MSGAGTQLYEQLFAYARAARVETVTAEFDIDPPNPLSARFHAKFGFREVGRQVVPYGMKEVSIQVAEPLDRPGRLPWLEGVGVAWTRRPSGTLSSRRAGAPVGYLVTLASPRHLKALPAVELGSGLTLCGVGRAVLGSC